MGLTLVAAAPAVLLAIAPEPKHQLVGLIGVLALATAWLCTYKFVFRPLSYLARRADDLAVGDFGMELDLSIAYGELGQLAEALKGMAQALENRSARLREVEAKYRALVEQMPGTAYTASLHETMGKLYISSQIGPLLGYSTETWLANSELWVKQIHPDDRMRVLNAVLESRRSGEPFSSEYRMLDRHGRILWFRDEAVVVRDNSGQPQFLHGVMLDTTERKHAEHALRESEERYRKMVDTAQEGIWLLDKEAKTGYVNQRMSEMLGYGLREILGHSLTEFLDPASRDGAEEGLRRLKQGEKVHHDLMFLRKDGGKLWTIVSANPVLDEMGVFSGALFMIADITERKEMEEQLMISREQLRRLTYHLQSIREEERTWISREIHDELGQALTGLKMDLSWIERKLSRTGEEQPFHLLLERIGSMSGLVDSTIQSVRKIATELRPGVLDALGLTAAIEWQASEFRSRTGIEVNLSPLSEKSGLDRERSTAVFRIFQEILTNVARHSLASEVEVHIEEKSGRLSLEVKDNGRGITEDQVIDSRSLGLLGMRERALLLGGEFHIQGVPGEGTTVTVIIPLAAG
jgi:PAS domain S-box-containing protein